MHVEKKEIYRDRMCRLDIIKIVRVVDYSATTATAIQSTTDSIINRERERIKGI
jgi:hypothetical protein